VLHSSGVLPVVDSSGAAALGGRRHAGSGTSLVLDQPDFSVYEAERIPTSGLPSAVPANQAAMNLPGHTSTMVLAWLAGGAAPGRTISAECKTCE
jgi:hypothetical protein